MKRLAILLAALILLCTPLSTFAAHRGYAETKYPIMLVHGLFGFDQALGVDYFYGIAAALQKRGAQVYIAKVSSVNTNEERGEQLLAQVNQVLAITGATKTNLIGHSQGAPTIRYVAGVAPELVASVTTVGGVNQGSVVADIINNEVPPGSISQEVAVAIAKGVVGLIELASGGRNLPQNPLGALKSLTTSGMNIFNQNFPAGLPTTPCGEGPSVVNGIRFYSWSGSSLFTNISDVSDQFLALTGLAYASLSDGLVGTCASHLGKVIKDNYRMNHLDEVNQLMGLVDVFEVNPVTLYVQHANRLKKAGL